MILPLLTNCQVDQIDAETQRKENMPASPIGLQEHASAAALHTSTAKHLLYTKTPDHLLLRALWNSWKFLSNETKFKRLYLEKIAAKTTWVANQTICIQEYKLH